MLKILIFNLMLSIMLLSVSSVYAWGILYQNITYTNGQSCSKFYQRDLYASLPSARSSSKHYHRLYIE